MSRYFTFETKNGNEYIYNDLDGTISPLEISKSKKIEYDCIEEFEKNYNRVMNKGYIANWVNEYYNGNGFKQLNLIITEECNLRCKYCSFSGEYDNMRIHSSNKMSFITARKAVDLYLKHFIKIKRRNLFLKPSVTFFGGEPLLEFELIKNIVEYMKKIYPTEILFSFTTNGTILNKEIINFLIENKFHVVFSLNGDKNEHDRLRVRKNGNGTFDKIYDNFKKIADIDLQYFNENCNVLACYDTGTDMFGLKDFFSNEKKYIPKLSRINKINGSYTNWYSRYSEDQRKQYINSCEVLKNEYFKFLNTSNINEETEFNKYFFEIPLRMLFFRPQNNKQNNPILPFSASCIPGDKISVSTAGKIYCCERVNYTFDIGDVDNGINLENISYMLIKYWDSILKKCFNCPMTRFCTFCYAIFNTKEGFDRDPNNICENKFKKVKEEITDLWGMFEDGLGEKQFVR